MPRTSLVHYINPASVSIVPNANESPNDLAVYVAEGTTIKVHSRSIEELLPQDGNYLEWSLKGRNRRLKYTDREYTIFARLRKTDQRDGYIVFAPKDENEGGRLTDKYPHVTQDGMEWPDNDFGEQVIDGYWYFRLGEVSLPENGKRTLTFDTGLLGTDQYNEQWEINPDKLPMRIELSCKVGDEELGTSPYVYWDEQLLVAASLFEGWDTDANDKVARWTITRNTGNAEADAAWNNTAAQPGEGGEQIGPGDDGGEQIGPGGDGGGAYDGGGDGGGAYDGGDDGGEEPAGSRQAPLRAPEGGGQDDGEEEEESTVRLMPEGQTTLKHLRGDDDFAGAVATVFTITAWEAVKQQVPDQDDETQEDGEQAVDGEPTEGGETSGQDGEEEESPQAVTYVPLAVTTLTVLAETLEQYQLILSSSVMAFDPKSGACSPEGGIAVSLRATDQRGETFNVTNQQFVNSNLAVQYRQVGSNGEWTSLAFSGTGTAAATGTIPASVFTTLQDSVNVRLVRAEQTVDGEGQAATVYKELATATVAFVRNGEDSAVREWIYYRSTGPVTFGNAGSQNPAPKYVELGQINPTGVANGNSRDKSADGWVPNGWTDDSHGVDETYKYEYESYRDSEHDDNTGGTKWGDFVAPYIKNHFAVDGTNGDTPLQAFRWYEKAISAVSAPTDVNNDVPAAADCIGDGSAQPSTTWSATAPDRPTTGEWQLFLTQSVKHVSISGDVTRDAWSTPVRISGDKGDAGEDSKEREWIYIGKSTATQFTGNSHPANITKDKNGTTRTADYIATNDDFVPYGWSDNAIAIDSVNNKFVYASWRDYNADTQRWGAFNDPILWSNWGVNGMDGDGVQYVYKLYPSRLTVQQLTSFIPIKPSEQNENGEWLPASRNPNDLNTATSWNDDAESVSDTYPYCYCSVIKRINGEWGSYEKLALWSSQGKDGSVVTIGPNGHWFIDGTDTNIVAEGKDGTGVNLKGLVSSRSQLESSGYVTPKGGTRQMATDGDCYVCEQDRHLYMWLGGVWNDLGEFKGEPGESSYIHIAHATWVDTVNHTVTGFTVDATRTDYDWMGICTDNQEADPGSSQRQFTDGQTAYNTYKWNYIRGKDGDGYENVYLQTKTATKPGVNENDSYTEGGKTINKTMDEYRPAVVGYLQTEHAYSRWTDDPSGVNATWRFEWQATRKKTNGSWGSFTVSDNPIHRFYRPPFWSRVYKRMSVGQTPATPSGGSYDSPVPSGWSDGIPAEIPGDNLVWTSRRRFDDDTTTYWSAPEVDRDSNTLDIEYAFEQTNDAQPAQPSNSNRHDGSGAQVWYDPVLDANSLPSGKSWSDMMWRAEREIGAQNWVITRIKGEKGDPGSRLKETEPWFMARSSKVTDLDGFSSNTNTNNNPPTTNGVQWYKGSDPTWSSTKRYLYRMDKNTATDNTVSWTSPYFYSEWSEQGPAGEDAPTVVFTPNMLIFNGDSNGAVTVGSQIEFSIELWVKGVKCNLTTITDIPNMNNLLLYRSGEEQYKSTISLQNVGKATLYLKVTGASGASIPRSSIEGGIGMTVSGTSGGKTYTVGASIPVGVLEKGATGAGQTGDMFYPMGEWQEGKVYNKTGKLIPLVFVPSETQNNATGEYGDYYYLTASSSSTKPGTTGNSDWTKAEGFGFVITQGIFANFARLGSAIISKDWLISANGTINGTPYNSDSILNPAQFNDRAAYTWFDGRFPMGNEVVNVPILFTKFYTSSFSAEDAHATQSFEIKAGVRYRVTLNMRIYKYASTTSTSYARFAIYDDTGGSQIQINAGYNQTSNKNNTEFEDISIEFEPKYDYSCSVRILVNNPNYWRCEVNSVKLEAVENVFVPNFALDLLTGKMIAALGNFVVNPDGSVTMAGGDLSVSSEGNLSVGGTVRASNFYHNTCIFYKAGDKSGMYVIGNDGNYVGATGLTQNGSIVRLFDSGNADTIMVLNNTTFDYDTHDYVILPDPSEHQHKLVEVFSQYISTTDPGDYHISCKISNKFIQNIRAGESGIIGYSGQYYDQISVGAGKTARLLSVYCGSAWYWLYLNET